MSFFDHPLSKEEYQYLPIKVTGKQMLTILTTGIGLLNLWFGAQGWPIQQNPRKPKHKIGETEDEEWLKKKKGKRGRVKRSHEDTHLFDRTYFVREISPLIMLALLNGRKHLSDGVSLKKDLESIARTEFNLKKFQWAYHNLYGTLEVMEKNGLATHQEKEEKIGYSKGWLITSKGKKYLKKEMRYIDDWMKTILTGIKRND